MSKKNFLILLLVVGCLECIAQQSLPINIPTPTAASLGRYGDVEVSHYNGTANIDVPIYSLNERGVKLDLKLIYNSSGVMMNSLPGWTGENWSLAAGGVITRSINGNPDELVFPAQARISEFHNYFEGHSRLTAYTHGNIPMLLNDAHYHKYDTEPDVFFFNFMGKTGKFFLGNDGSWKVISDENLDILFDVTNAENYARPFIEEYPYNGGDDIYQPNTIYGFKIRDTEGTIYTFGYSISAIEYFTHFESMSDFENIDSWLASAWYLTKVEDRIGNVLYELQYERGPFTCQWTHFGETTSWEEHGYHASNISGYSSYSNLQDPTREYSGQLNSPTYLSGINTNSGLKLTFYSSENRISMHDMYPYLYRESGGAGNFYSQFRDFHCYRYVDIAKAWIYLTSQYSSYLPQNWSQHPHDVLALTRTKQLNSIYLYNTKSDERLDTRIFRFKYNTDESRMHLNEFCICNSGSAVLQSYKFRYNQYDQLPHDYLTRAVDHWGYYNGTPYQLPSLVNDSNANQFYLQRNPDTTKVKYGALEKIIYPTGGTCLIEYESNDFSKYQQLDRQGLTDSIGYGGGIRVKSIAEYDDSLCTSLLTKRTFSYLIPGTNVSSGQLFSRPIYYWKDWEANVMGQNATSRLTTFRASSIVPLSNSFGSPVGYSYVTECLADGSKTEYHYSNISDSPRDILETLYAVNSSSPSPFDKYTERGYARGKLLTTSMFDATGRRVRSSEFKYRGFDVENNYTYASNLMYRKNYKATGPLDIFDVQTEQFIFFPGRTYRLFHRQYYPYEQTDSLFFSNGTKQITKTEFDNRVSVLNFSEPYSHRTELHLKDSETCTRGNSNLMTTYSYPYNSEDTCTSKMAMKQFVFTPETEMNYRNNNFTSGSKTKYAWFNNKIVMPKENLTLLPGDSICDVQFCGYKNTGTPFDFIDSKGIRTGVVWGNNDNLPVLTYTGLNIGECPAAPECAVYDPEKNIDSLSVYRNISALFPINYSYDRLGNLRSTTSYNGISTYYNYDRFMKGLTEIMDDRKQITLKYDYNVRR